MKKILGTLVVTFAFMVMAVAGSVYSGFINVAADEPHSGIIHDFLEYARNRSIAVRLSSIEIPKLDDAAKIEAGSGNYDSMCASCHLIPGQQSTELSQGLYPSPPNLTVAGLHADPARTFWIVKHGIKASGMPAWGHNMDDQYIWEMVAFLKHLPSLDTKGYRSLVSSSGGHQHGGGETSQHNDHHSDADAANNHEGNHHSSPEENQPSAKRPSPHVHADGKEHEHAH